MLQAMQRVAYTLQHRQYFIVGNTHFAADTCETVSDIFATLRELDLHSSDLNMLFIPKVHNYVRS